MESIKSKGYNYTLGREAVHLFIPDPGGCGLSPECRFHECTTPWKISRSKKTIYAICEHGFKFKLDERNMNGSRKGKRK